VYSIGLLLAYWQKPDIGTQIMLAVRLDPSSQLRAETLKNVLSRHAQAIADRVNHQ
jgi:hypothetical protein